MMRQLYSRPRRQLKHFWTSFKKKPSQSLFSLLMAFFWTEPVASSSLHNLERLQKEGFLVSAVFANLSERTIIEQMNPNLLLTPASITKLVIAAKALEVWGPEKRFESAFYSRGSIDKEGVLKGDLIFLGGGDPSLTNEKLIPFIFKLQQRGLKKITGNLILNLSHFGNVITEDTNRALGSKESSHAYDSPLSAVAMNYSVIPIVVTPTEKNQLASVYTEPFPLPGIAIRNKTRTVSGSNPKTDLAVRRVTEKNKDIIEVRGQIHEKGKGSTFYRSVSDAEKYAAELLISLLKQANIKFEGEIVLEHSALASDDILISSLEGDSLEDILKPVLRISNNFVADMLTLQLIKNQRDIFSPKGNSLKKETNIEEGRSILENFIKDSFERSKLTQLKKNHQGPPLVFNGSGLDVRNKLSAAQIVAMLERLYFDDLSFPVFIADFPSPGTTGTLRQRFSTKSQKHLISRIRAKTGTLQDPVDVNGLGGYFRFKNGQWGAFCILVNGTPQMKHAGIERLKDAIDHDISTLLNRE